MQDGALEHEYLAELALDRENAGRGHAPENGQDVFAGELNHEVTTASRLVLEGVGLIEEHLVRTKGLSGGRIVLQTSPLRFLKSAFAVRESGESRTR